MRALLIEFDRRTGKRAGGINPKDPKLQCYGWQNLEREPALEIRVVEDDRDLSYLKNIPGITFLEGKDAINAAIDANIPPLYTIQSEFLMREDMKERGIPVTTFSGMRMDKIAKEAYKLGLAGVIGRKPEKVK